MYKTNDLSNLTKSSYPLKGLCGGSSCGMVANVLDDNIMERKFEVKLCCCIHF